MALCCAGHCLQLTELAGQPALGWDWSPSTNVLLCPPGPNIELHSQQFKYPDHHILQIHLHLHSTLPSLPHQSHPTARLSSRHCVVCEPFKRQLNNCDQQLMVTSVFWAPGLLSTVRKLRKNLMTLSGMMNKILMTLPALLRE